MMPSVRGDTQVRCVIGDPVSHSFSPQIQNYFGERLGLNSVYAAMRVLPENLGDAIRGAFCLGICGINVTVPHKREVMEHLKTVDGAARVIGAVNTLKLGPTGYSGFNTDWIGAKSALELAGASPKGKKVLIIGAGGSAHAAAYMAAAEGAEEIFIANRTWGKAAGLAERIEKAHFARARAIRPEEMDEIEKDIVIQTTTVGFGANKEASPVSGSGFFSGVELALDFIYSPWETQFLKAAAAAGSKTQNGFPMLVLQAAASLEIWTGKSLEKDFLASAIEKLSRDYLSL
ncbi:MAG: shikimate dehydrogenase [Clostridiales bacterium]|jgi:shikimate dehydrogenase|nr:shikimate dehydrogenase [Clostridiales bacterium]